MESLGSHTGYIKLVPDFLLLSSHGANLQRKLVSADFDLQILKEYLGRDCGAEYSSK